MDSMTLILILIATTANGLIGLAGVVTLWLKDKQLSKILLILVSFSAGALLSGAFFHLLSEALDQMEAMAAFSYLLAGFVLFFLIEKFLHWHHCHEGKCEVEPVSQLILFGDAIHNFIDGLVIAASFLVNPAFGFLTTLIIIMHEIPQELGNFGVLVYWGFGKKRALVYSFIAQLTSVIGGIAGFFLYSTGPLAFLLPFAAGGFIYISASDLVPELHKEQDMKKYLVLLSFFLLGIVFLLGVKLYFGG